MSSYEEYILKILKANHLKIEREKSFKDLKHGLFRFDFYLPDVDGGVLIEMDGEYHFKPIRGRRALMKQQEHDRRKNSYCLVNQIPLYRIPYWDLPRIKKLSDIITPARRVNTKWWNDELWKSHIKSI